MESKRTYAGIDAEFADPSTSKISVLPVPYDGTSTWGKGADKGPEAFLDALENMELYDIETNSEVYKQGIVLEDPVAENGSPESMTQSVHQKVNELLAQDRYVTMIGGEHSVSIGAIQAFNQHFSDLSILQIDAHADLRPSYEGSAYNHACALHEASQNNNLVQVGIRSMDVSEKQYMQPGNVFFAHDIWNDEAWGDKVLARLGEQVYLTIDMDAFDPSIFPSTGTPEPGGLKWYETLRFLKKLFREKKVVGFDLVELCPNPNDRASDFMMAKLHYKLLSYQFEQDER